MVKYHHFYLDPPESDIKKISKFISALNPTTKTDLPHDAIVTTFVAGFTGILVLMLLKTCN